MYNKCFSLSFECFNACFWISTFIVPFLTYLIIQKLRPRLGIDSLSINQSNLKVKVFNKSRFFDSNNLRIEICIYDKMNGFTYHFEPDHIDFLILPCKGFFGKRDNSKTFVSRKPSDSAILYFNNDENNFTDEEIFSRMFEMYKKDGYSLRVRCHSYHSFSGLGKSFEKIF